MCVSYGCKEGLCVCINVHFNVAAGGEAPIQYSRNASNHFKYYIHTSILNTTSVMRAGLSRTPFVVVLCSFLWLLLLVLHDNESKMNPVVKNMKTGLMRQ